MRGGSVKKGTAKYFESRLLLVINNGGEGSIQSISNPVLIFVIPFALSHNGDKESHGVRGEEAPRLCDHVEVLNVFEMGVGAVSDDLSTLLEVLRGETAPNVKECGQEATGLGIVKDFTGVLESGVKDVGIFGGGSHMECDALDIELEVFGMVNEIFVLIARNTVLEIELDSGRGVVNFETNDTVHERSMGMDLVKLRMGVKGGLCDALKVGILKMRDGFDGVSIDDVMGFDTQLGHHLHLCRRGTVKPELVFNHLFQHHGVGVAFYCIKRLDLWELSAPLFDLVPENGEISNVEGLVIQAVLLHQERGNFMHYYELKQKKSEREERPRAQPLVGRASFVLLAHASVQPGRRAKF